MVIWVKFTHSSPFLSLIPRMSTFTLAISCLTTSNLPWFMDLTFQVPMQYCSLQHRTLLLSPITSTTGYCLIMLNGGDNRNDIKGCFWDWTKERGEEKELCSQMEDLPDSNTMFTKLPSQSCSFYICSVKSTYSKGFCEDSIRNSAVAMCDTHSVNVSSHYHFYFNLHAFSLIHSRLAWTHVFCPVSGVWETET